MAAASAGCCGWGNWTTPPACWRNFPAPPGARATTCACSPAPGPDARPSCSPPPGGRGGHGPGPGPVAALRPATGGRRTLAGGHPHPRRQRRPRLAGRPGGDLADLCDHDPAALVSEEAPAAAAPAPTPDGPERVLLLVQTSGDRALSDRRIAELEGLVRSAGAVPVGRVEQRRQGPATRNPWGRASCGRRPWRPAASAPAWWWPTGN